MHILAEIKAMRRRDMDKQERFRLNHEDMREDSELRKIIIESIAASVSRIVPDVDVSAIVGQKRPRTDPDAQKAAESRRNAREAVRNQAPQSQQPPRDQ